MASQRVLRVAAGCILINVVLMGMLLQGQAANSPTTVAEIALYRGADREQVLIEGAKKEGQFMIYTSNQWMGTTVPQEFGKKYPFIKVSVWRGDTPGIVKRVSEEYATRHFLVDVIETSDGISILQRTGVFQEYHTPEAAHYGNEVKERGKNGVFYLGDREVYTALGFNTKLVPPKEAPKTYKELLDPKWKGKMAIAAGSYGPRWVGHVLNVEGREYLEKLRQQDVKLFEIVPAALTDMVISGEVPLSPTIGKNMVFTAKQKGAPIEWLPLEPVITNVGFSGLTTQAPHPCAALLFLDYVHSREGQKVVIDGGISSPREDIGSLEQKFKKTYIESQYTPEELDKKYAEWEQLMRQLFVRKK